MAPAGARGRGGHDPMTAAIYARKMTEQFDNRLRRQLERLT